MLGYLAWRGQGDCDKVSEWPSNPREKTDDKPQEIKKKRATHVTTTGARSLHEISAPVSAVSWQVCTPSVKKSDGGVPVRMNFTS